MLGYFILHLVSIHPKMRQTFFLENNINFLGYNFFLFYAIYITPYYVFHYWVCFAVCDLQL